MKRNLLLISLFFLLMPFYAFSQKVLVLEKTGKFKTHMYYEGNQIKLQMDSLEIHGRITKIYDSLLIINQDLHVPLSKINYIKRQRFWLNLNAASFKGFSLLYLLSNVLSRSIQKKGPIIQLSDLLVGGVIYGSAVLLERLWQKKCRINKKWQLKVIDLSL